MGTVCWKITLLAVKVASAMHVGEPNVIPAIIIRPPHAAEGLREIERVLIEADGRRLACDRPISSGCVAYEAASYTHFFRRGRDRERGELIESAPSVALNSLVAIIIIKGTKIGTATGTLSLSEYG